MAIFSPSVYRHEQVSPAVVWSIEHNLGNNGGAGIPIVDVFITDNSEQVKIIPARIEKIDANTVEVEFTAPTAGTAIVLV